MVLQTIANSHQNVLAKEEQLKVKGGTNSDTTNNIIIIDITIVA